MVFSSTLFLFYFLPLFLLVYHLVGKKLKNTVILIASIFFYSWGAPKYILLVLLSTLIDFQIVKNIANPKNIGRRKILLATSILISLGQLIYFKYANFFIDNVNSTLGHFGFQTIVWTKVLLPIGISFYTFQTITYTLDVYRKTHEPFTKYTDYLLYILCFPQLIAGPIVRFSTFVDQLHQRSESIDEKLTGFYRFVIGLSKKVLIANVMAEQADAIFHSNLSALSCSNAWLGILAYTLQIYFDFSGYSDMAIGLGRIMGFKFPENFDSPYTARSISEFWQRWHITLGSFMREYLYIPLGGNRVKSKLRLYLNLSIVFLLSGLWHGASWNFVLWGAYHGLFQILDRTFLIKLMNRLGAFPSVIITFLTVMIGWVIFRLENVGQIVVYLTQLFSFSSQQESLSIPAFWPLASFALVCSFLVLTSIGKRLDAFIFHQNSYALTMHCVLAPLALLFIFLCTCSITASDFNPFIYFRF